MKSKLFFYLIFLICFVKLTFPNEHNEQEVTLIEGLKHPEQTVYLVVYDTDVSLYEKNIHKFNNLISLHIIGTFSPNLFSKNLNHFQKLKELTLNRNELATLPLGIASLIQLEELDLAGNNFDVFPIEILQLKNLKNITFGSFIYGYNKIETIPKEISQLKQLTQICFLGNNLTQLPDEIGKIQTLEHIYLGANKLTYLPNTLRDLKKLKTISIEANKFTKLPEVLLHIPSLEKLSIHSNQGIVDIEGAISSLSITNINYLNIGHLNLHSIPKSLANFPNLETLSLYANTDIHIDEMIDVLSKSKSLKELKITAIDSCAAQHEHIQSQLPNIMVITDKNRW